MKYATIAICGSLAFVAGACKSSGPSYAPRQPVSGVDRPQADNNPYDDRSGVERGPSLDELLDPMIERIAGATKGPVAVFPALGSGAGQATVTALGEMLMEETTRRLEQRGVEVISGDALRSEMQAWNRPSEYVCSASDVRQFASQMGFEHAVMGTAGLEVLDARSNESAIMLDWECVAFRNGGSIARVNERLSSGTLAQELARLGSKRGAWSVCRPNEVEVSLEREFQIQGRILANQICRDHVKELSNDDGTPTQVRAMPTVLPTTIKASASLAAFRKEYYAKRKQLEADGSDGPAQIMGTSFASISDAGAKLQQMQQTFDQSPSGQVANQLAEGLGQAFEDNSYVEMKQVASRSDLEGFQDVLSTELFEFSDIVDPDSVAFLEAEGTQVLVRSTLRQNLDGEYVFVVTVHNINTNWKTTRELPIAPYFTARLAAALR